MVDDSVTGLLHSYLPLTIFRQTKFADIDTLGSKLAGGRGKGQPNGIFTNRQLRHDRRHLLNLCIARDALIDAVCLYRCFWLTHAFGLVSDNTGFGIGDMGLYKRCLIYDR